MGRVNIEVYKGKKMISVDFSYINVKNKADIIALIEEAKSVVSKQPAKSVLMITNVTGTGFDSEVTSIFKEYSNSNTPYIKASALVGVSGLQKIILQAVKQFTKREYNLFNTVGEAKDWLATQ